MSFNENLKALRKEKHLTQMQLADKCGVSQQVIQQWEKGKTSPDLRAFNVLRNVLGVSADYLLDGAAQDPVQQPALSSADEQLLHKLHSLDTRGRQAVLDTLDREYSYMKPERQDRGNIVLTSSDYFKTHRRKGKHRR